MLDRAIHTQPQQPWPLPISTPGGRARSVRAVREGLLMSMQSVRETSPSCRPNPNRTQSRRCVPLVMVRASGPLHGSPPVAIGHDTAVQTGNHQTAVKRRIYSATHTPSSPASAWRSTEGPQGNAPTNKHVLMRFLLKTPFPWHDTSTWVAHIGRCTSSWAPLLSSSAKPLEYHCRVSTYPPRELGLKLIRGRRRRKDYKMNRGNPQLQRPGHWDRKKSHTPCVRWLEIDGMPPSSNAHSRHENS